MSKFEKFNSDSEHTAPKPEKESRPGQLESAKNQNNTGERPPTREPSEKTPEELKKIEEIRRQIQDEVSSSSSQQEEPITQNPIEIEIVNGEKYYIEYVPKEDIYPAYGYAVENTAVVRQDLPPRIKKFVKAHELYHCQDKSNFGGWLGREIRANVIPGLKDPIGLAATVWKTITDIDRIKFYLKRIKEGH